MPDLERGLCELLIPKVGGTDPTDQPEPARRALRGLADPADPPVCSLQRNRVSRCYVLHCEGDFAYIRSVLYS